MAKQRKKLLIVDGYNVLRSGRRYRTIAGPDYTHDAFNRAREALVNDVVSYAGRGTRAVIVYDGKDNALSTGEPDVIGGVRIMFSPAGQSADKVIEKLAHDARERGVATIQDTVFGGGVDRMSADGFSHEIEMMVEEVRQDDAPAISVKNTVAERLSPDVLRKLKALRDGS